MNVIHKIERVRVQNENFSGQWKFRTPTPDPSDVYIVCQSIFL